MTVHHSGGRGGDAGRASPVRGDGECRATEPLTAWEADLLILCVVFALLGAASNAMGTVLQRKAALVVPQGDALRVRLLLDMARQPVWLLGIVGVAGAALFQALALVEGPLALAQPVFILELPFALLIALPVLHRSLPRSGWVAVACVVAGLVIALSAAAPSGGRAPSSTTWWIGAVVLCFGVIGLAVVLARRLPSGAGRAALLGTASAVGNALTAALIKSAVGIFSEDGLVAFLTAWQTYGFAISGIAAVFLLENALQAGPIAASQPALTLGDATFSLLLGIILFSETIRTGWWIVPELAGVGLIVYGTVHLSRAIPLIRDVAG